MEPVPMKAARLAKDRSREAKVVCPWHAYAFDPCTGENEEDPEVSAVTIESKIEDGELRGKL